MQPPAATANTRVNKSKRLVERIDDISARERDLDVDELVAGAVKAARCG